MKDYKRLPILSCKIGDSFDIVIYPNGSCHMGPKYTIKEFLKDNVLCYNSWTNDNITISNKVIVEIPLSKEEIEEKYFLKAKEIVVAMSNKLYDNGGYPHEMWNEWACCVNPYDMAKICEENSITVIGYFPLYEWKKGDLDIGVLAEDNKGDRFWCHANSMWFERWRKMFPELYE